MESICGGIKEFNLPKILISLNNNKKTGTLTVRIPPYTKKIYFDTGNVIFASSTSNDDKLGPMLIKAGKITFWQYEESVMFLKMTGKKLSTILVERGYLTPKDLYMGVTIQVKEIIYSLFPLEYAEYEFEEGEIPKHEVLKLKLGMGNLIYEGVKRINNFVRIKRGMPDMKSTLVINIGTSDLFEGIELTLYEKNLLSMIDGIKTIIELVDNAFSDSSPFEVVKSLYFFWLIGVLKEKETTVEEKKTEKTGEVSNLKNILRYYPDFI